MGFLKRLFFPLFLLPNLLIAAPLPDSTLLEQKQFAALPKSAEIDDWLKSLAKASPYARVVHIGKSVGGRDYSALLLSKNTAFLETGAHQKGVLTVLLIGSQHGTEPSGNEALQQLALDVVAGKRLQYLDTMNLILIPNGNPDGRDNTTRLNAVNGNLNVDYMRLAYPETRIYRDVLARFKPDALLDMHESSIHKKTLTDRQGYFTDVEAQYEVGNNPNIDARLRQLTDKVLLPALIAKTEAKGLPAQHYLGEIQSLDQPVAHGGLRLSNLRNYSAMLGVASFLVENRLDPLDAEYPTPQNIQVRRDKQYKSACAFLEVLSAHASTILTTVEAAKTAWKTSEFADTLLQLDYRFGLDFRNPQRVITLRSASSGKKAAKAFPNHDFVLLQKPSRLPKAYAVTAAQEAIATLLRRHGLEVEVVKAAKKVTAILPEVEDVALHHPDNPLFRTTAEVKMRNRVQAYTLKPGDLLINTRQANGLLIPLLLDARSVDSLFQEPQFRGLLVSGRYAVAFPVVE